MRSAGFALFLAALCAASLGGIALGRGGLEAAFMPPVVVGVLYAALTLHPRTTLLGLTFLALTLENPSDMPAAGLYRSPLYDVGAVLLAHLNLTLPYKPLLFSVMDLILIALVVVVVRPRPDGRPPTDNRGALPVRVLACVCLAGIVWVWSWGVLRGEADHASALWQVQRVIYLPVVLLLFLMALRESRDHSAIGQVVVAAACVRAAAALYVRATVAPPAGEAVLPYATAHADSMLFAIAVSILVALLIELPDPRRTLPRVAILVLLTAGMVANNRRLVWVEVIASLAVIWALLPRSASKRALARAALLASPLVVLYCGAGWSSTATLFRPVQVLRSVVDSRADMSTSWRDLENYDLFYTIRNGPLLGSGYGHGYAEIVKLPDVSSGYALYRYAPHNSILGLWAYGGLVGFAALWTLFPVGLFMAARAASHATSPLDRVAALSSSAALVAYSVHCYGDMGLGTWTSVFTVAPALAIAGRLAVSTGAWPDASQALGSGWRLFQRAPS